MSEFLHLSKRKTLLETTTDDVMSTTNGCGQKPYNVAGERPGNVNNPAQRGRREDGADRLLLPRKPVIHRRRSDPRTQGSLDMYDFETMTISKQTEGILSPQEDNSETRKIHGFSHQSKDLLEPQREEMEMGRIIHAKKLMLLEALLNLEEKVRQKLQSVGTTAGDDQKYKEESHNRAAWPQTRLSEQGRRQSVKHREDRTEEGRREGGQRLWEKQHPRDEDRMRYTQEEQRDMWRLAGVRSEHRREVNDASTGSKYRGKEKETPQMIPHKPAASHSTENHRGAEGKTCEGSSLPPISKPSSSSSSQQHEVGLVRSTDTSFHLLPCRICNRQFMSGRLEKHVQICEKVNQSRRRVFDSYINRTKGSAIEEFCKTHRRSKSPEV